MLEVLLKPLQFVSTFVLEVIQILASMMPFSTSAYEIAFFQV